MLIYGEKVFLSDKGFKKGFVETKDGKIVSFSETSTSKPDISAHYVFPGFIGIHTHAATMASEVPAKAAALKTKGKIEKGFDADLTILNENFSLCHTVVGGKIKY